MSFASLRALSSTLLFMVTMTISEAPWKVLMQVSIRVSRSMSHDVDCVTFFYFSLAPAESTEFAWIEIMNDSLSDSLDLKTDTLARFSGPGGQYYVNPSRCHHMKHEILGLKYNHFAQICCYSHEHFTQNLKNLLPILLQRSQVLGRSVRIFNQLKDHTTELPWNCTLIGMKAHDCHLVGNLSLLHTKSVVGEELRVVEKILLC